MHGCLGCWCCRARATVLLPVGLQGLARRLPSHSAAACSCAPLLPWRVQSIAGVCPGLAAGRRGGARAATFLPPCCPSLVSLAVRVAGYPVRLSLALACRYPDLCGLCFLGARSCCPSGTCRVPVLCLCVCAPVVSAFPPPFSVSRALCEVLSQGAARAIPCGRHPSAPPAGMPSSACPVCRTGRVGPVLVPPFRLSGGVEGVRKSDCHVFPRVLDPGQAPSNPWKVIEVNT